MTDRDYITVSELNYFIKNIVQQEELLQNVPVVGEISGCSVVNGNCYFTIKDEKAQIKGIYFNCKNQYTPANGEKVLIRGMIDYYQPTGQISLKAYSITRFGVGLLHAKLEELKKQLDEEGLFSEEHKKTIPPYPRKICVITSSKGAAIQDILSTLKTNNSMQELTIIDVRVQGDNCASDIICALKNADKNNFDVIILARGGGSFEDLYAFNDEMLVRTIYDLNTPVVTGVGHETDYTLCDFVSDYRAITPTAAAKIVLIDNEEEKKYLLDLLNSLKNNIENIYNTRKKSIENIIKNISYISNNTINNFTDKIRKNISFANFYLENNFRRKNDKYMELLNILDNINPTKLLKKGYFRIISDNTLINNFKNIKQNSEIKIIGDKEKLTAIVTKKEKL